MRHLKLKLPNSFLVNSREKEKRRKLFVVGAAVVDFGETAVDDKTVV
jgi:hypothetical protein